MNADQFNTVVYSSQEEKQLQKALLEHFKQSPLPDDEILSNLGMFLTSKNLSRLLFFAEIYKKILNYHGVVVEFGTRWGQTLSFLAALRGIYEPFNRHRKVIGFDTFQGFRGLGKKDGGGLRCQDGDYSVAKGYEGYLDKLLWHQEQLNPVSHVKKYELIKGDAVRTIPKYFKTHPETIISLAIFDFDIYQPTKIALETIKPHLCKGSILVFDELCDELFPGETIALQEVFGLNNVGLKRMPITARISYWEFV